MTGRDRVGSHGRTLWLHLISVHEKSGNVSHLEALKDGRRWQVTRDFPQLLWNCVPLWWCQKCKLLLPNFERTSLFSLSISFPSVCIDLFFYDSFFALWVKVFFERERGRERAVLAQTLPSTPLLQKTQPTQTPLHHHGSLCCNKLHPASFSPPAI